MKKIKSKYVYIAIFIAFAISFNAIAEEKINSDETKKTDTAENETAETQAIATPTAVDKKEFEADLFDRYWAKDNFEKSDWHKFQEAAKWYRKTVLKRLKPLYQEVNLPV